MYRVLLPVDETESRARAQANAVLELPETAANVVVDVLYVHEEMTGPDAEWAAGGFSDTYAEEMSENIENADRLPNAVEIASDVLNSAGVEHAVHERAGEPAETILAVADESDSDVLVLGVRDRSPVGKVLFGSVVQAVILDSDRPVMTVPPT